MKNVVRDVTPMESCAFEAHFIRLYLIQAFAMFILLFRITVVFHVQALFQSSVECHSVHIVTLWVHQEIGFRIMIHFLKEILEV